MEIGHKVNCNEYTIVVERPVKCRICILTSGPGNLFCLDSGFAGRSWLNLQRHLLLLHCRRSSNSPLSSGLCPLSCRRVSVTQKAVSCVLFPHKPDVSCTNLVCPQPDNEGFHPGLEELRHNISITASRPGRHAQNTGVAQERTNNFGELFSP